MANFWKDLKIPFTLLAPMESVTDYVFREVVSLYLPKPDVLFTEFTNVDALNSDGFEKTISRFKFSKREKPIVAQIWGVNAENFYKSAKLVSKLGFSGIDINMGCPDKAVVKGGAGSALIGNNSLVKEIIEATKKGAGKLPVSVKTRIGIKKVETDSWITFLLEQKIDALTIHGRTAKELSKVPCNWEEIGKAVQIKNKVSPETIIIGNGDVVNFKEVVEKHNKYKVDGVMIGRGIFNNPWVFEKSEEEKKRTQEEYKDVLLKHLHLFNKVYGKEGHFDVMKKFFKMYIHGFKGASALRGKLMQTKNINEVENLL